MISACSGVIDDDECKFSFKYTNVFAHYIHSLVHLMINANSHFGTLTYLPITYTVLFTW